MEMSIWSAALALVGALPRIVPDLYGFVNYLKWGTGGIVVFIAFNLAPSLAGTHVGVMEALLGTLSSIGQGIAGCAVGFAYEARPNEVFNLEPAEGFGWWEVARAEVRYPHMLGFTLVTPTGRRSTTSSVRNKPTLRACLALCWLRLRGDA